MNADQLKGKWVRFKGELKQQYGKFTDDDLRQIEGQYDKVIGQLQERYGGNCASLVRGQYGEKKNELISLASRWRTPWVEPTKRSRHRLMSDVKD